MASVSNKAAFWLPSLWPKLQCKLHHENHLYSCPNFPSKHSGHLKITATKQNKDCTPCLSRWELHVWYTRHTDSKQGERRLSACRAVLITLDHVRI